MKILYGVQGTGNGHLTRARLMAQEFKKLGVDVDWVFSGRDPTAYFDMAIFGDYRTFKGLTFVVENGRVNYRKTLFKSDIRTLIRDIRALDISQYDCLLNDFEPVSAWAARMARRSVIGISHQCAFRYAVPHRGMHVGVRAFMRGFAPVTHPVGLHWAPFTPQILPPMVDVSHMVKAGDPARVLVYLPFASDDRVLNVFAQLPEYCFDVYMPQLHSQPPKNVRLHQFSREGFQAHLAVSESVICSAGFELPSECLQMGKRLLVIPISGQAEQESNALALAQLAYATVADGLNVQGIRHWLTSARGSPMGYPNVSAALVKWILAGAKTPVDLLAADLWRQVKSSH